MLAAGVASVQNVLDLEAVVIGGGLADRLGPSFVERIAKAMHPHLFVDEHPRTSWRAGSATSAARRARRSSPPTRSPCTPRSRLTATRRGVSLPYHLVASRGSDQRARKAEMRVDARMT